MLLNEFEQEAVSGQAASWGTAISLLGKPFGGHRPIGVTMLPVRTWLLMKRLEVKQFEIQHSGGAYVNEQRDPRAATHQPESLGCSREVVPAPRVIQMRGQLRVNFVVTNVVDDVNILSQSPVGQTAGPMIAAIVLVQFHPGQAGLPLSESKCAV
eukprot:6456493-Amphidinium_carterae.3